jgi:chitodextrinase
MIRVCALLVMVVTACKDDSGTARKVSPATKASSSAPEPPGGPPSCADVGAHLAAGIGPSGDVHAKAGGADITVAGAQWDATMEKALVDVCREDAWSHETRACVLGWNGNLLRERAQLAELCPGIAKR